MQLAICGKLLCTVCSSTCWSWLSFCMRLMLPQNRLYISNLFLMTKINSELKSSKMYLSVWCQINKFLCTVQYNTLPLPQVISLDLKWVNAYFLRWYKIFASEMLFKLDAYTCHWFDQGFKSFTTIHDLCHSKAQLTLCILVWTCSEMVFLFYR